MSSLPQNDAVVYLAWQNQALTASVQGLRSRKPVRRLAAPADLKLARPGKRKLRFLRNIAALDPEERGSFVTLTTSEVFEPEDAKRVLCQVFLKRLQYQFEQICGYWVLDLQERGAPHFHLLVFNAAGLTQTTLQRLWSLSTGESNSTVDISQEKCRQCIANYMAKRLAESTSTLTTVPFSENLCRHYYGCFNRKHLPKQPQDNLLSLPYGAWFHKLKKLAQSVYSAINPESPWGFNLLWVDADEWAEVAQMLYEDESACVSSVRGAA